MSENEAYTQPETAPHEAVITLYQSLGPAGDGGADGHALARHVWQLEAEGCQVLHLRINSAGGSVLHGYSLFSALRHTRMQVHTWLDGLALSMAGLIFLAGEVRHVAPWGLLMLHNPSMASAEEGNPADPLAEEGSLELLTRIRASLLEMYATRTALPPEQLSAMMDAQTWLTATRSLELGLATYVTGKPFPAVEKQLDLLAASAPVFRLEPAALDALAACVQNYADGGLQAQASALQTEPPTMPDALRRLEASHPAGTRLTFRDLEKQDPKRLEALRRRDPAAFRALYEACYKS